MRALLLEGGLYLESDCVWMLPWGRASLDAVGSHDFHRSYKSMGCYNISGISSPSFSQILTHLLKAHTEYDGSIYHAWQREGTHGSELRMGGSHHGLYSTVWTQVCHSAHGRRGPEGG